MLIGLKLFVILVTEDEIDHGIFKITNPNASCLCYTRSLSNLSSNLTDDSALQYIDVNSSKMLDVEAQELLHDLKWRKLPEALDPSNVHHYTLQWVPGGISESNNEHAQYMTQLCEQVYKDLKHLIDTAKNRTSVISNLHSEILHHAQFCKSKSDSYYDRNDGIMESVKSYILNLNSNVPLIIHGKSGSGKTSIMSETFFLLQLWMKEKYYGVVRFLGTSPMSSMLRLLLVSIIEQIGELLQVQVPNFSTIDTIDIIQFFRDEFVPSLANHTSRLVILLDSVDQLNSADGAHFMKWLPTQLPSNVKLIVSVLEEKHKCLVNLRSFITSKNSYVHVGVLQIETGLQIMNFWLSKIGRTLSEHQKAIILDAFLACPQPLFLRLLFGHARNWKSYTDLSCIDIPKSTAMALSQFYDGLELRFGKMLVRRALGYLTASKEGLTEAELEDVLSLDNEVLDDVYQYWDPPFEGVVRIPCLLWKRIHHHIDDYIVEQRADGKTVLKWYHRQFIESATKRYVESLKIILHSILSEYFDASYANGKGKSVNLTRRNLSLQNADRQVASQPLQFSTSVFNYRKLTELPFHFLYSRQIDKLRHVVLCNYKWIFTKLKATGYVSLIQDYVTTLNEIRDEDISLLCDALSLSGSNIRNVPDMLAGQLIARLFPFDQPSLQKVCSDARNSISTSMPYYFKPNNHCLISPGQELMCTLSGHPQRVLAVKKVPSFHTQLLVSYSKGTNTTDDLFHVWDTSVLECIQNINTLNIPGFQQPSHFVVTSDHLVAIKGPSSYMLWNLKSGCSVNYSLKLADTETLNCVTATSKGTNFIFGTSMGMIIVKSSSSKESRCCYLKSKQDIKEVIISSDDSHAIVLAGSRDFVVIEMDTLRIMSTTNREHTQDDVKKLILFRTHLLYVAGTCDGTLLISTIPQLNVTSIPAHSKNIKCIVYVPMAKSIITGSLDKLLRVWDLTSFTCSKTLKGHSDGIWCAAAIPETTCVISGSKDDYLRVWDIQSGECLNTLEGHSSWITCVTSLSRDIIVSGSNDKNLKIWNINKNKVFKAIVKDRHVAQAECVIFRSSSLAISCAPDATKVWNPTNGVCLQTFNNPASCLTFTRDMDFVLSGNIKGTIEIYKFSKNSLLDQFRTIQNAHSAKITCIELCQAPQNMILSASLDSTMKIWNSHFIVISALVGHQAGITCVKTTGHTLVSGSQDGDVRIWNLASSKCTSLMKGHTKAITCLALATNNTQIISGSDDFTARVWNMSDFTCICTVKYIDSIKCIVSIDSLSFFIAGSHSFVNQLKSWDTKTGICLKIFEGHTHAVMCMLPVKDRHIITGSRDGTVCIWSISSGEILGKFDLQSQIKRISITEGYKSYLLAATTKSGPIAFLQFITEDYHSL